MGGDTITVHATGKVPSTGSAPGRQFWCTKDPGEEPFTYQAGVGQVITGWDQGCLGMEIGEARQLIIPAAEGYGEEGFPAWRIPGGATLEFEIECTDIAASRKCGAGCLLQ